VLLILDLRVDHYGFYLLFMSSQLYIKYLIFQILTLKRGKINVGLSVNAKK
jgi:hypothetical protein